MSKSINCSVQGYGCVHYWHWWCHELPYLGWVVPLAGLSQKCESGVVDLSSESPLYNTDSRQIAFKCWLFYLFNLNIVLVFDGPSPFELYSEAHYLQQSGHGSTVLVIFTLEAYIRKVFLVFLHVKTGKNLSSCQQLSWLVWFIHRSC